MVPWKALKERNIFTSQCAKREEWKIRRLSEEDMRESMNWAFQAYGRSLATVTLFKYLLRVLTAADDKWPEVVGDLRKARKI